MQMDRYMAARNWDIRILSMTTKWITADNGKKWSYHYIYIVLYIKEAFSFHRLDAFLAMIYSGWKN
jgi:hypothetical protein